MGKPNDLLRVLAGRLSKQMLLETQDALQTERERVQVLMSRNAENHSTIHRLNSRLQEMEARIPQRTRDETSAQS